ncbi:MAG: DUF3592 domain-containing protein [Candidatus Solibacter sp.]|jgi:hypothetical protein
MMKLTQIGVVIAVGLVAAFGLYLFGLGLRNVTRAVASSRWPRTAGKVVRSDTEERHEVNRDTGDASVTYSANTMIQYDAAGKRYSTNLIHFGQTLGSGDASEAELQRLRYPVGGEVSVSYDPRQPWIAAARPGLHAEAFWLPGAGLAFLLPAVLAFFAFLPIFRAAPQQQDVDEFKKSVETAIENARRGIAPPDIPFRPPKDQSDFISPLVAGLFAAVLCGLGILALSGGAQRLWRGSASQHWPSVEGKVLFSRVNTSETRDSNQQNAITFSPQFVYTYEIGGVKHFNNRRRFGRIEGSGEDWAEDISARYKAGRGVRVYYYPADPDVAVLEPGNNSEGLWLPGLGLVALLFGLAIAIWIVPAVAR